MMNEQAKNLILFVETLCQIRIKFFARKDFANTIACSSNLRGDLCLNLLSLRLSWRTLRSRDHVTHARHFQIMSYHYYNFAQKFFDRNFW